MLADDRPKYPMSFVVKLRLTGKVERSSFDEALDVALDRHPLLNAIVGPGKQNKDCWLNSPNPKPKMDWSTLDDPIEFENDEYIDLRNEVGLRAFGRSSATTTKLIFQFHHASCDGIGAYQFIGDVLFEYARRTGDTETTQSIDLIPKRLRARSQASYNINNFRLANGKYQRTWDEALKHLSRSNMVLRSGNKTECRQPFPGIQAHTFDRCEYKQLRLIAQSNGQVLNDMLVEKLFETLHQWKPVSRSWNGNPCACVMMPMNLREVADRDISACNIVSHGFIRRSRKQLQDKENFRKELANELLHLKASRHKIRFMHMIAGGHYFYPWTMKASLNLKKNLATTILSNTGDPTKQFHVDFPREDGKLRCGNLLLDDISGVPPLRPGTNATISIFTYRRNLKICMRCDPNQFSDLDTRRLLNLYVENIAGDLEFESQQHCAAA